MRRTAARPRWWPHFSSTLRSTAVTARLGRVLGIAIAVCFGTGLLSELQYHPLTWLPWPAAPVWIYRLTQGVHVLTGTACLPLVLVKLWSVYPNLWRFPPVRSVLHALERASVAVLVSATLVQLATGYANALDWYPFRWYFVDTHHYLAYVVMGSVLLHVAVKLPDIVYGLRADVAEADVLTEVPWEDNPASHSNAGDLAAPPTPAISRRGVLAATGAGLGVVVLTTAGQTLTPLEPVGLFAIRQWHRGPQQRPGEPDGGAGGGARPRGRTDLGPAGGRADLVPADARRPRARGDPARPGSRSAASRAGAWVRRGGGSACWTWSGGPGEGRPPRCRSSRSSRSARTTSR